MDNFDGKGAHGWHMLNVRLYFVVRLFSCSLPFWMLVRSSCVAPACFHLVYRCEFDGRPSDVEFVIGVGVGLGVSACSTVVRVSTLAQASRIHQGQ